MQLRILFLLTALLPIAAVAQTKFTLDFGSPGDRDIWISDRLTIPAATLKSKDSSIELPAQGGKSDRIYIWDRKSGNLASKPVGEVKAGWKLTEADFKLVGKVSVRVEHKGEPVSVAFVSLRDDGGTRESQIDPDKKGTADFYGVKPGNVVVTVKYNIGGKDADPVKQIFVLTAKRSQPEPTFVISLMDEVETVASSPTDPANGVKGEAAQAKSPSGGSVLGNALVYLLGLAGAAAVIYYGLRYMKQNQEKVREQLLKVGVEIPDPADTAQAAQAVAQPITPAPPQKIILDDADPHAAPTDISSPLAVTEPSLVMNNGDVFVIPEGQATVGRDATCELALVAESTVSRKHAIFHRQGSSVVLADTGSSNGTFVNGMKIEGETPLRPGDQIQFGQAAFRFEA